MKILFAASGEIAVETLNALYEEGLIGAVLTSMDEKGGRGNKIIEPPVKVRARELSIPVYQFESLKSEARKEISKSGCDTLVSFCYGKIFGPKFLSLFERKYNIHPSLLPKYRGCSPLYETIINLDREAGISIQEIALAVDEGDIINTLQFPLDGTERYDELERIVAIKASLLARDTFKNIDSFLPRKQEGEVSYSGFIKKEDGRVDFNQEGAKIHALIRATYPWPKAYCDYNGSRLILSSVSLSAFALDEKCTETPGTVVALDKKKGLKVATKDYYIYISRLQSPAKKEMDALSFTNGDRNIIGSILR